MHTPHTHTTPHTYARGIPKVEVHAHVCFISILFFEIFSFLSSLVVGCDNKFLFFLFFFFFLFSFFFFFYSFVFQTKANKEWCAI
eukprot:NODE_893_length_662_cov_73.841762_g823_i0.p2 GENE.NODE_893_length_662_cov_73.841762_g823_i0~~NODE_893_length_662_cov_73.841762_g823_i0.p2  ORF type:complete len:85 (-),score=22.80 NODE_893_length_662_cov_73.841762_g823_i0:315-569(-)